MEKKIPSLRKKVRKEKHTGDAENRHGKRKRLSLSKELQCMMYGFENDHNPYTEQVNILKEKKINKKI